ncbi:MAG TPA: cyclopropane-fatty-acyl-phospholipid synthase family protein [Gaiellaceae bacterium]|nr:cyclopropane-fatty-acyl-phospholipid synthase family protein [Gaiellaceae bacterium]
MTTVDRDLPRRTTSRPWGVGRIAESVLERVLPGVEGGTLVLRLPDGSQRRYGSGREAHMQIDDWRLLRRIARSPKLALGESYQAGEWRSDDLVALLELLLRNAGVGGRRHPGWRRFAQARPRINRRTGVLAARRNIEAHYDLGNDLFALFLDETMTYSCALFEHAGESLEDAQRRKLFRVCEQLELGPDDHLLEIGCGWGSLALTAAGEFGARVTAVTISPAQAELARSRIAEAGLAGRITVVERDFRELDGTFTKIASIEMLEAIGEKLWTPFFAACDRLLAPGGRACIQTIIVPDERLASYRSSPDWIERHIFPGCLIPSREAMRTALGRSRLRIVSDSEIGGSYAETLRRWRERFHANLREVRALGYDERFVRTWDFYLASCEALFRTGLMRDAQIVLAR